MKKYFILLALFLFLMGCENQSISEVPYEGQKLHIAVIGEIPDIHNENLVFESLALDELSKVKTSSSKLDAIMITPDMFVDASQDNYSEDYFNAALPIVLWDSSYAHHPFVTNQIHYLNEEEIALNDSDSPFSMKGLEQSHSTLFLYDLDAKKENVWFFNLEDKKRMKYLYAEIFNKIEELTK